MILNHALAGIKQLPRGVRKGVYMAYTYYLQLFNKIKQATATVILEDRIRIPDAHKTILYFKALMWNSIQK